MSNAGAELANGQPQASDPEVGHRSPEGSRLELYDLEVSASHRLVEILGMV
jgi:hypothetical protein